MAAITQTLLFARDAGWTPAKAKDWARCNGYRYGDARIDVTEKHVRIRQVDPAELAEHSFRTITFGKGIKAVLAYPGARPKTRTNPHPAENLPEGWSDSWDARGHVPDQSSKEDGEPGLLFIKMDPATFLALTSTRPESLYNRWDTERWTAARAASKVNAVAPAVLWIEYRETRLGLTAYVRSHEGRHRTDYAMRQGAEFVPVTLRVKPWGVNEWGESRRFFDRERALRERSWGYDVPLWPEEDYVARAVLTGEEFQLAEERPKDAKFPRVLTLARDNQGIWYSSLA